MVESRVRSLDEDLVELKETFIVLRQLLIIRREIYNYVVRKP